VTGRVISGSLIVNDFRLLQVSGKSRHRQGGLCLAHPDESEIIIPESQGNGNLQRPDRNGDMP